MSYYRTKQRRGWLHPSISSSTSTLLEEVPFQFPEVIFLLSPLHFSSQKSLISSKMHRKLCTGSGLLFAPVRAGRVNRQKSLSPVHVPTSKNVRCLQGFFFLNFHNFFLFAWEGKTKEKTINSEGSKAKRKQNIQWSSLTILFLWTESKVANV